MGEYGAVMRACPLFDGIEDGELVKMLGHLDAKRREYPKGGVLFSEGDPAEFLGIVLSGKVQVTRTDYDGNRSVLTSIPPSGMFAEAFVSAGLPVFPVDVTAAEDTVVLLIPARKIMAVRADAQETDCRLLFNLLRIVSRKNLLLHDKIEVISKRTTREKLMAYLSLEAKKHGSRSFRIPYDRQALADYLSVDRSGLSAEIGKLCKTGVLECKRENFRLKKSGR